MELALWTAVLIASLAVLVKSADGFTDSSEAIGLALGVSPFIIGVTIVAIGTSLPELVSSSVAVLRGSSEIVVGNVVGSNIANIFLVLGLAAVLGHRLRVTYEIVQVDLPLLVASAFMMALVVWDREVTVPEALALVTGAVIYVAYAVTSSLRRVDLGEDEEAAPSGRRVRTRDLVILGISAVFLYLGATYTVESVVKLSEILGIGAEVLAISAVALGTSLPELTVSVVAARKGNLETAMGNVLGSTIFNCFAVVGISALLGPLVIPASVLTFGLPVMVAAALLYFFMAQDKEVSNWEGWVLILFYALFLGKLFELF